MKKILLTCFLALPCLFQKARIKLKAKKEHLGFPCPSTAPRCDVLIKYLAVGVSHVAKRSVFRAAYLQNKLVLTSPLCLTLTLLCCTSPTLSKSAQSPLEPPLHRSAVPVSPNSGDTHRGEETLSDTFTQVDDGAEVSSPANYTTSLTTLDGGPTLRSPVSRPPASTNETASLRASARSDAPQHRTLVLSRVEASDTQHRTSLRSAVSRLPSLTNFGLINPDQDMGAGEGTSSLQSAPFPVLPDGQFNSGREAHSQSTEAQSLVSNVLCLESRNGLVDSDQDMRVGLEVSSLQSPSVPVFRNQGSSGREAHSQSTEAQSLVSNVLCLESSNGLVDPDQDMGAGEGTSSLQSAPFPVLPNGQFNSGREALSQSTEAQSLVSKVLTLASSNGFSDNGTIPKTIESVLFLELPSAYAADTLWLTYWDHYLGDSPELTLGTTIPLVAFQGDFFQGNMGFSVYKWTSTPSLNSSRVFKIRNGKSMLVNTWTIFPGDQARIRFDLLTGNAQFIGPSAEFFRAQYLLSGLAAGRKIEIHPLMVTRNPDRMLLDSSTQARFTLARSLSPALFPPMEFLAPGENASGLLDSLLTQDLKSSSVIRTLPELTAQLTTLQKEIILQQAWGELLTDHISRLSLLKNLLKQPENLRKYEEWKAGIPEPCPFETFEPAYLKAFYDLALLEAQIYDQALFTILDGIPSNLRDLILGRYLMSTWRTKKGDQFAGLQKGLTLIETPWIAEKIQLLQESILPGSEFLPTPLIDTSGNAYDLNQLKGKSLLISFWISGCKFCINYYQTTLKPIFEKFGGRKDLAFISVNADKNESYWKDHLASGNYAHPEMINLHLDGGTGLLKEYSISSFPQKLLVDSDFRLFLLTKNQYSPDELSNLILRLTEENRTDSVSKPK